MYEARELAKQMGKGAGELNATVDNVLQYRLGVPPVLRCMILRDLGLLTEDSRLGTLYDLDMCWTVLSRVDDGLKNTDEYSADWYGFQALFNEGEGPCNFEIASYAVGYYWWVV